MSEKEKNWGNGKFSTHVYVVQARATFGEIVLHVGEYQTGHLILTPHEWKTIPPARGPIGVPNKLELYYGAAEHGFMTYACAMALACWLQAEQAHGGIETRVVQIQYRCEYSTEELGTSQPLNLWEDDRQLLWRLQDERKQRRDEPESVSAVRNGRDNPS